MTEAQGSGERRRTVDIPTQDIVELHREIEALQRIVLSMAERASIRDLEDAVQEHRARRERDRRRDADLDEVVSRDPAIVTGGLVFAGTRVPSGP